VSRRKGEPLSSKIFEYKKEDKIAVVIFKIAMLKGEEKFPVIYEFSDLCSEISSKGEVRILAILLEGEKTLKVSEPRAYDTGAPSLVERVAEMEIPVIVGMDGYVLGRDLELALACDIRLATPRSYFGFPDIDKGIIPSEGGTQRLPRIVGRGKALEMILTGCIIDSDIGCQIGLVNRIVEEEELYSATMTLAKEMSEKSPTSLMYSKEAINKGMEMTLEQGIRLEADLYYLMHTTHDRIEGIKAFQEKRTPEFKGR
jgi:enoyl-CoA hydratase/carnithine racemase